MELPTWVLQHKIKGTEIRKFKENYYLYKVTSKYNPEKKRSQKITVAFLGTITENGLIKTKLERLKEGYVKISVKDFGDLKLVLFQNQDIVDVLKELFPSWWQQLFVAAFFRFVRQAPLCQLEFLYQNSYISEIYKDVKVSDKAYTKCLQEVGTQRINIVEFFKKFNKGCQYILIDSTHVMSLSKHLNINQIGYNSKREFEPQVNVMFIFSTDAQMPVYYRIIAGNIREISAMKLSLQESELKNVVLIGDKGFYSSDNEKALQDEGIHYILPLKRNSSLIDYLPVKQIDKKQFDGYFLFEDRIVWYYKKIGEKSTVVVFVDELLKAFEQKDYLTHIENKHEGFTIETYHEKQHTFGTIAIITDLKEKTAQECYNYYKNRGQIETMIDAFKNTIDADRTYMRGEKEMETWMFINYIALLLYYRTLHLLRETKLSKKYSPADILLFLSRIKMLYVHKKWTVSEIPKKTQSILKLLNIPIT
jgi:transposase